MENIVVILFLLCVKGITHISTGSEQVDLPPVITSEFESEYFFPTEHSTSLTLRCQAENGNITYEWFKSFMKLDDNQRVTSKLDTGEIVFTNLTTDDFGVYYCLAKNEFGASISAFVKILETRLDSFPSIQKREVICREFHHCKLSCYDKPRCEPRNECRMEWKIGPATSENVNINENMTLDDEGNLHFLNIHRSYVAKGYYCGVWNEREQIFKKGSLLTLHVEDSAEIIVPPRAVYQSGYKGLFGGNVTLQCIFSGNPVPEVTWQTRNGSHIVENHKYSIRQHGRQLQIRDITFKDDDVYKCISQSIIQNPYLNVTSIPLFPDVHKRFVMKAMNFTINDSKELLCNAMSAPDELEPSVIRWMKNGEQLNQDSAYRLSNNKKTLHIYKAKLDDAGCYTCVMENSEGIAVANFLLYGVVPIPDHLPNSLTTVVLPILCAMGVLLLVGSLIISKKIREHAEGKRICAQLHRNSVRGSSYSVATIYVYSEPHLENPAHENIYDFNTDSEVEVQPEVVNAENNYDILGECSTILADTSESKCYDCLENIDGIYNTSFRGNVHTGNEALNGLETLGKRESLEKLGEPFSMLTHVNISKSSILDGSKEFHEIYNTNFIENDLFDDESNDTFREQDTPESNYKMNDALDKTESIRIGEMHVTIPTQNSKTNSCDCSEIQN